MQRENNRDFFQNLCNLWYLLVAFQIKSHWFLAWPYNSFVRLHQSTFVRKSPSEIEIGLLIWNLIVWFIFVDSTSSIIFVEDILEVLLSWRHADSFMKAGKSRVWNVGTNSKTHHFSRSFCWISTIWWIFLTTKNVTDTKDFEVYYLIPVEQNSLDCSQLQCFPRWVSCKSCTQFLQKRFIPVHLVCTIKRTAKSCCMWVFIKTV